MVDWIGLGLRIPWPTARLEVDCIHAGISFSMGSTLPVDVLTVAVVLRAKLSLLERSHSLEHNLIQDASLVVLCERADPTRASDRSREVGGVGVPVGELVILLFGLGVLVEIHQPFFLPAADIFAIFLAPYFLRPAAAAIAAPFLPPPAALATAANRPP